MTFDTDRDIANEGQRAAPRQRRQHIYEKHNHCEKTHCPICDGGLALCTVCKGAEGSLPTECPGKPMDEATQDAVYNAALDFRGGEWVDTRGFL